MNLLLIRANEQDGPLVRLVGQRATHVREVLRATVGQELRVGLPHESMGTARVLSVAAHEVVLGELSLSALGRPPSLRLVLALPRPKALRRILQTAACFGVAHIDLVNAWRVSKSYWGSPALEVDALGDELWLGCEQGRHAWLPSIACHRLLLPFIDSIEDDPSHHYICHPGGSQWLSDVGIKGAEGCLAIGPEGGWIAEELTSFARAGFLPIVISRAILRSEIALAAALAQWEMCDGHLTPAK